MAKNTTEAEVIVTLNGQAARNELKRLETEIEHYERAATDAYNAGDKALGDKMSKNASQLRKQFNVAKKEMKDFSDMMKTLNSKSLNELKSAASQLRKQLGQLVPGTQQFIDKSKQLQQVNSRIKSLEASFKSVVTEEKRATLSLKGLADGFNKWGIAIMAIPMAINKVAGALRGVIDVTKQVVNASQTMGDKWNNGMAAMKTTTEAFFMALSSGDWTAFNDGIAGALKNARDLAETMDLLASYAISADYMRSEYLTSFQEHLNNARDTGLTEEERQAELEAAKADMEAYNQTITEMADVTRESLIKEFKAVKGIDYTGDLQGFDAFFDELYKKVIVGGNNMVAEAKKKLQDLTAEIQNEGHWEYYASEKGMERVWVGVDKATASMRALKAVTEEYGEDVANLARASELSDDELKSLLERYQQAKSSEKEVLTLERQLTRTRNSLYSTKPVDAYAESIKKIDKALEAQKLIWKRLYANGLIDKQLYEARIAEVEEDFLKQKMETAKKYGKDTDQFMEQLLDRQISRLEKAKEMLKEEMEEMARYYEQLDDYDSNRFGNKGTSSEGDTESRDAFFAQKANEIRMSITDEGLRDEYELKMKWAEKMAKDGLITEEEAEKYKLKMKGEYAAKIADVIGKYASMASDFVNQLKEAETQKLEAEYQAQLTAAGDNAEEREKIEAEHEKKKLEIQKRYADVDMVINIAKTIAAGALAVMQAFAQLGPVAGAVMAAAIGITTGAEVATIIAQRNAIKNASVNSSGSSTSTNTGKRTLTGYAEGGYTEGHTTLTTVGEEGTEYVIPHWMVRKNPVMVANLERYRRSGSHGRSGSVSRGFADGGFTSPTSSASLPSMDVSNVDWQAMREFNSIMRYCAENGLFVKYGDILLAKDKHDTFKNQTKR